MGFKIPFKQDLLDRFELRWLIEKKLQKELTKLAFNLDGNLAMDWLEDNIVIKIGKEPLKINRKANTVEFQGETFKYDFSVITKLSESLLKDEFVL